MFDKQIMHKLESMLNQMNPEQKNKLADIMKDEESLKKAISGIDPQKARQAAKNMHLEDETDMDVGRLVETLKKNSDLIKNIDKKL
ncbi:MAG: hypothetical protein ACI4QW_05115 [Clostridia bacterium]